MPDIETFLKFHIRMGGGNTSTVRHGTCFYHVLRARVLTALVSGPAAQVGDQAHGEHA